MSRRLRCVIRLFCSGVPAFRYTVSVIPDKGVVPYSIKGAVPVERVIGFAVGQRRDELAVGIEVAVMEFQAGITELLPDEGLVGGDGLRVGTGRCTVLIRTT